MTEEASCLANLDPGPVGWDYLIVCELPPGHEGKHRTSHPASSADVEALYCEHGWYRITPKGRDQLTGRDCSECGRPTRTGPLGGPNNDTEYSCEEEGCDACYCWDCLVAQKHEHDREATP